MTQVDEDTRDEDEDEEESPQESTALIDEDQAGMSKELTSRLVFAVAAAAFGSAFQHGYNTGVINSPQDLISQWISNVKAERSGEPTTEGTVTMIWSIAVSIFCVGGMIGGCTVGIVADKFGRKGALLYNNILVVIAAICMGCSKLISSYELLILGRFIIGVNAGLNAGLAPVYLTEISPVSLRGALGTVYQLVITISIALSQILGLAALLGSELLWPVLLALTVVPAVLQLATLPMCPESPKHVLQSTGNELKAKQVLTWLRGDLDVHEEIEAMKSEGGDKISLRQILSDPSLRAPLFISAALMLAQQFSGINAAMYYSTNIFKSAQLSETAAQYATLSMGAMNSAMTVVSLVLVEKAGRKTLLLVGFSGMLLSTLLLVFCLLNTQIAFVSYLSVVAVLLFVLFFSIGPGSIPWFIVTELFTQAARPVATSVAVTVNWSANFIVGIGFLPLEQLIGSYVFLIFAILQFVFIIFIFKKVPETKNKTTEEITAMFRTANYQG
ncbi:solute carrier family 2, facilitated glucose transporter member 1 isoform X2 [Halyomorpha halys]|uniref:solute carrier family 2, facilitated glucose transporter member 1 isoform X2 n=1 Tax=Halyomorpha halys TaxID=286706 RepID=UPI0006D4DC6B|nr:solute carrier family 2, facilitated glucose transporter member 1 isoform X1 [Halyomorpha halys]